MGAFKEIFSVLENYFPDEDDYDKLFHEFYEWLNNEDKNHIYIVSNRIGYYLNLCNETEDRIDDVCEYWCKHIKLNNKLN